MPGILDFIEAQKKKAAVKAAFAQSGYVAPGIQGSSAPGAPDTGQLELQADMGLGGARGAAGPFAGLRQQRSQAQPGSSISGASRQPGQAQPGAIAAVQPGATPAPGLGSPVGPQAGEALLGDGFARPGQDLVARQKALGQMARDQFGDAGDPKTLWRVGMYLGNQGYVDAALKFLGPIQQAALEREQTASEFGLSTTQRAQTDQAANQRNAENLRLGYARLGENIRQFNIGETNRQDASGLAAFEAQQPKPITLDMRNALSDELQNIQNAQLVVSYAESFTGLDKAFDPELRAEMGQLWQLTVIPFLVNKMSTGSLQEGERQLVNEIRGDPEKLFSLTRAEKGKMNGLLNQMQQDFDTGINNLKQQGFADPDISAAQLKTRDGGVTLQQLRDAGGTDADNEGNTAAFGGTGAGFPGQTSGPTPDALELFIQQGGG